jgi:hypothetical protein
MKNKTMCFNHPLNLHALIINLLQKNRFTDIFSKRYNQQSLMSGETANNETDCFFTQKRG